MKLAENEIVIDEYTFSPKDDDSHKCILTSNRLTVVYRYKEETYPLSKINAVTIEKVYNVFWGLVGVAIVIASLIGLGSNGMFYESFLLLIIGAFVVWKGFRAKMMLSIIQSGGKKQYTVKHNKELLDFVDNINTH